MLASLLILPALAQSLGEQAPPPDAAPSQGARYVSASTLLFFPNNVSASAEHTAGMLAVSVTLSAGYTPDLYFFGGWAVLGGGPAVHLLPGRGARRLELAIGLDGGVLLDADPAPFVFPTAFLGFRRQPAAVGERLLRVGAELSLHSALGLTVSLGRGR